MKKIELIIFDLDGILVETCEWHREALNLALKNVISLEIPKEVHDTKYNGLPTRTKLDMMIKDGLVNPLFKNLILKTKQEYTTTLIENNCHYDTSKIQMLINLRQRFYQVACFTNCSRKTAELMLEKTGLLPLLHFLITNEDITKPKPDPEGYIKMMKYFDVPPEKTLILEDSPTGLMAAKLSGACVIETRSHEINLEKMNQWLAQS